jgi:hypothetical protein
MIHMDVPYRHCSLVPSWAVALRSRHTASLKPYLQKLIFHRGIDKNFFLAVYEAVAADFDYV